VLIHELARHDLEYASCKQALPERAEKSSSSVKRLGTSRRGEHLGAFILEVEARCRGAATTSHGHSVAMHTGRLSGGLVVDVVAEVVPNLASGLMAGGPLFAGVNMGRGGATEVCELGLEGRDKEPSGVASLELLAVAVEHCVCGLHHGLLREARCGRWQGQVQRQSGAMTRRWRPLTCQ